MKDKKLVNRIIKGDKNSFSILVENYKRLVTHIVYTHVRDQDDRNDLCQEIFLKIYQNLSGFQFKSKLSTWIGKIAYNSCINYYAGKKVKFEELSVIDQTDTIVDNSAGMHLHRESDQSIQHLELSVIIEQKIRELPDKYQTVLVLYHMDELSYKEISEILDISLDNTKVVLHRARNMLKSKLLQEYKKEDIWN